VNKSVNYDIIIIGCGMSGLSAGIRLSYYGKKVLIVEQHSLPGGLNSFYRRKGMIFDVGLHAITNFVSAKQRQSPLNKLFRQLKLKWKDFNLIQQKSSCIQFPEKSLNFSNDIQLLKEEIYNNFPSQVDGFSKLQRYIEEFDALSLTDNQYLSTRKILREFIDDSLLIEMLLCPVMYYGSSSENDMDFSQFAIMFRSIFLEGFSRPETGVKHIIDLLLRKFNDLNGELRFKTKISKLIIDHGMVKGVKLDTGEEILAEKVLSSAGLAETEKLAKENICNKEIIRGKLSFTEVIVILKDYLSNKNYNNTIMFYNDSDKFSYQQADDFIDLRSGVICSPDNFAYSDSMNRPKPVLRITNMANYQLWSSLDKDQYQDKKLEVYELILDKIKRFVPLDSADIIFMDMFTPVTVEKFTGHFNGAVYGSPLKIKDGVTNIKNLFICGTDQGFLGIVGSMLSGVSMANLHCLK